MLLCLLCLLCHLQRHPATRPAHLGWRMWLITAASACSSCNTFSGSCSWPRSKSSAVEAPTRSKCHGQLLVLCTGCSTLPIAAAGMPLA